MGGKTKQAQRTKNNVRPSSSGRSAELLSGGATSGSGCAPALFPSLASYAPAPGLNADLALAIKKLNKKDPITRIKALQELNELIKSSEVDDVVALLPNWTHLYKTLSLDPDRKIRELTQLCHSCVAAASGRRLAPHLRALLPSWLAALGDGHAPARARAHLSLHATFPDGKLPAAVAFCKEEVVGYLVENLLNTDTAVGKQVAGGAEAEAAAEAAERAAGWLRALGGAARLLGGAQAAWLRARLQPLLARRAFWALPLHPADTVRYAWYEFWAAAGALLYGADGADGVDGAGGADGAEARAAARRALGVLLRARDAGAAPLWEALSPLLALDTEWSERPEQRELLTKKMIELAASGGGDGGAGGGGALAPLLAALPAAARTAHFYESFFDACFKGLSSRRVQSSRSERAAWGDVIVACVRGAEGAGGGEGAGEAALRAHRTWLTAATRPGSGWSARETARLSAALLRQWARGGRARGGWLGAAAAAAAQLAALPRPPRAGDVTPLAHAHVQLMLALRVALTQEPKKSYSIKFEGDAPDPGDQSPPAPEISFPPTPENSLPPTPEDPLPPHMFEHDLATTEDRLCAQFLEFAAQYDLVDCVIGELLPLLEDLPDDRRLVALSREFGGDSAWALWARALRPWLARDVTRGPHTARLALALLPHLSAGEQEALLQSLEQLAGPVAQWAVALCACQPLRAQPAVRGWLRGGGGGAVRAAAAEGGGGARALLLACLTPECLLSEETVTEVLHIIAKALDSTEVHQIEESDTTEKDSDTKIADEGKGWQWVNLASVLATTLAASTPPEGYSELLRAMFMFDLRHEAADSGAAQAQVEARGALHDGLSALGGARDVTAARLLRHLQEYLAADALCVDVSRVSRAGARLPALAGARAALAGLCAAACPLPPAHRHTVTQHALTYEVVSGRLSSLVPPEPNPAPLLPPFAAFARSCLLRAEVLRAVCCLPDTDCSEVFADAHMVDMCVQLMHDAAVVRSLYDGYQFWSDYVLIETTEQKLSALLEALWADLGPEAQEAALSALARGAAAGGRHWAAALARRGGAGEGRLRDVAADVTGDGFFHTLQMKAALEPSDDIAVEAAFLSMQRALLAAGVEPRDVTADGAGDVTADGAGDVTAPSLEQAVDAHYRHPELTLQDSDLNDVPWVHAVCAACTAELAARLVARGGWELSAPHWDFVTLTQAALLAAAARSARHWDRPQVAMVVAAALRLHSTVAQFAGAVAAESLRRRPAAHVAALPREWRDVFRPPARGQVCALLLHVLEHARTDGSLNCAGAVLVRELSECVRGGEWAPPPPRAGALQAAAAAALASRAHLALHHLAYDAIMASIDLLIEEDVGKLRSGAGGAEGAEEAPALALGRLLAALGGAAPAGRRDWLAEGGDEEDAAALAGWLLGAEAAGALLRAADADPALALRYAEEAHSARLAEALLAGALARLPRGLRAWAAGGGAAPPPAFAPLFAAPPPRAGPAPTAALPCRAVVRALEGAGAGAARGAWAAMPARAARAFRRLVVAYVSPALIKEQLAQVAAAAGSLEDMEVRTHASSGEVLAVARVEERRVELALALAPDHPLTAPRVVAARVRGSVAPEPQWLGAFLAHGGGAAAALRLWSRALQARLGAAPTCYVCYSRLAAAARLPQRLCRQCRNTFHTQCLLKWFASSRKASCPVCRAAF